ncbi:MAG TPA: RodZ domain-containing protein [Xanthomonadales bacterium]|nr:RodZ domain-containing protein [Xanthomonadales bacterium]
MIKNEHQAELILTPPGERLQHAREARGLSVAQISKKTLIRERIIRSIENDDTGWIAPIYLRGYVKTYAKEVGLDPALLEAEARAASGDDPELRSVFNIDPKRGFTERWLKSGGYLVATALIAALVWQVTQQAVQLSEGTRSVAGSETAPAQDSDSRNENITNSSRQNSHLAASIASLEKLNTSPESRSSVAHEAWSAINTPVSDLQLLNIRVSADSWVEIIDSKGAILEKDLLRGGNERHYKGTPPFEVMLGRPSAVEVEYNGESVDLEPHIRGDVARLTLGVADKPQPEE